MNRNMNISGSINDVKVNANANLIRLSGVSGLCMFR